MRRSTSCRRTPTAARRWTCGRSWPGTAATDAKIWWTEWGPGSQHFHLVGDSVFAATFLLDGMVSSMGRLEALSHWVASDHFEELGRPQKLEHGGFGLLTVGNLRKPRWWALALLDRLGDDAARRVGRRRRRRRPGVDRSPAAATATASACWSGTAAWTSRGIPADELLARDVTLTVDGLAAGQLPGQPLAGRRGAQQRVRRLARRSAVRTADWPEGDEWDRLPCADELAELEPERTLDAVEGAVTVSFVLPQPGISFVELRPA